MLRASLILTTLLASGAGQAADGPLEGLRQRITSGQLPNVHSVIVLRDGKPLAEWYFTGTDEVRGTPAGKVTFDGSKLHDLRSVSKSVVALLVGIAQAAGQFPALDQPVLDSFREYPDLRTPERLKVHVGDVLSMTSGLAWDEATYPYTDPRNSELAMDLAPDRYRYVLDQKVVTAPGKVFSYSGGSVALVAAILARATKTPLEVYAQEKLFRPLGITRFDWLKDSKGVPIAASGLRLTPPDMAKLGQLVLAGGLWNGKQVVPRDWITAATTEHVAVDTSDAACGLRYGYYWWLGRGCGVSPPAPWFAAFGNGGQRIWVVPSRKLVVVSTAGNYNDGKERSRSEAIFKAALEATK